ncbi:hypothetical protein [Amycolatopsis sp. WQ 127309]|uniref:8-oxoguanine DNA glycosylase OGG fold protein n=1 Tax=Amycolatopsis sp. WQ 127309 TaxID=2932773 RepID=UPI001FF178EB|nr:hypothetical protein [Amycolatopsis sp. WQ 127309]UOZ05745.1 hypothetical protein MUY22_44140 [Amycolatopsis sp. WQ 127309]
MSNLALSGKPKAITVDPSRWAARLPSGAWPDEFALSGQVWRADVFALAQRWRSGEVASVQFAAGVLAWGYGIRGYGPHRTNKILRHEQAADHLDTALAGLRADLVPLATLLDCYEQLRTTAKLKGLGPAFFTKILYFAGYRRGHGGPQPLILDSVVAAQLPPEAGAARRFSHGWSTGTWRDYLLWAAEQAGRTEYGGEPDRVEMALFTGCWRPVG